MNKWIIALERRPLSHKLAAGFALLLLGTIAIGIEGMVSQQAIMKDLQVMHDKDLQGVANGKDAQVAFTTIGRTIRQALITTDAADRERSLGQLADARVSLSKQVDSLRSSLIREENKKYLALFEENYALYLRGVDKAIALLRGGKNAEAMAFVATMEFQKPGIDANGNMAEVVRIKEAGAHKSYLRSLEEAKHSQMISIGLLAFGLLSGILLWLLVSRSVSRPLERLRDAVKQLASGKLDHEVPHSDYGNEVGELARAVVVLQTEAQQMEAQRWIKTHMATVSAELQVATSFTELSQTFLSSVAPLLKVGHAVFYLFEEEQRQLRLLGSYAFNERKNLDTCFAVGQGLVGQCALERAPIIITQPPADYIRIGSSLGEAVPTAIAVLPVLHNEQLLAVIELATFETFGVNEQALLDGLMPVLAMSMEIIERNTKTRQLLEETRRQAESMEKQAAKLEEQAVEMEAQQHEIKATEAWFRSIVESAPDGILVVDEQGTIILTNHEVETIFGYQPGELVGSPIEALVPQDVRSRHVALRDSYLIDDEHARSIDATNRLLRGVRKDGSELPVELSLSRLPAIGGRGKCVCASVRDITARKEAEERVAAAEERSRLILGAVGDGIVGLDTDGNITFANPAAPAMLGYAEDEFVGQKMHALVHHHYPDGREFPREECSMYLTSHEGQALTVDNEVLWHRDGSSIPVEYTTTVIRKGDVVIGTVVVYRDITERKKMEEEIKRTNFLSDIALELTGSGYWVVDYSDPDYYFQSERAARILGEPIKPDGRYHLMDEWFSRLQEANMETANLTAERYQGAIDGKYDKYDSVYAYKRPIDSKIVWIHAGGKLVRDEATGKALFMYGAYQDITEEKAAEEKLRHANFLNDQALDLTKAGYWHIPLTAEDGYYNSSERAATIFGDPPRPDWRYHLMNEWGANVVAGDKEAAEATFKNYAAALEGTVPRYDATYAYKRPIDGRVVWIHAMGDVVRDAEGKPTDMYGVTVDVTEAKLAEDKLREARQIAEEATRTKSDFLANMSHEIRTPMNAIIGMSHLALQTQLDKKQRNYIEKVKRAGENLLGIINDILDFSKIEAGKMTMEKTDFHLEDVMDNLANLVGMKTEDKGLELLFNCAPDVPTSLVGDPLRLGQVLINLGNNAVKFTEQGEIVVGVDKAGEDESGVELHFWVKDSGIGMTPEQCGKMFQSFSQADASTTRKYGGTGLGLVISKNLVEQMQGRIWVESEAGKGSTFHFTAHFGLQENPLPRRMFLAEELLGVRVLVVDDNASAREILTTMAQNFGLEVDTAQDGQQALNMIAESEQKQLPYDLVLMDWKMPVMDGVETVQHLQDVQLKKIPSIIMVTAYGREEAIGSAEQRGIHLKTVLTKPVNPSTLLEAIGEVLGRGTVVETRGSERADDHTEIMAQLSGARLLLVEDNDMNQELALELLQQAGISVVIANNGQESLDILAKDATFDGVLMDCQMPVMDGYTATREIRKNPAFKDLPIIAMTANAMSGDREKVLEAGMWDHIAKPLNVADMYATIAKWIKPSGAPGVTVAPAAVQQSSVGLPPLPGIDVAAGLATTMNNQKLYTRMLIKFRDSQGNFSELFAAAQQDSDPTAAERAAHTLKGTAGNIGARGVQAAAGDLEQACKAGNDAVEIDGLLAKVVAELEPVISGLQQIGAGEAAPANAAPAMPKEELQAVLDRLKALLEDNDSAAGDLLSELLDRIEGTSQAKSLQPVADAINSYDFDEALEKLQMVTIG